MSGTRLEFRGTSSGLLTSRGKSTQTRAGHYNSLTLGNRCVGSKTHSSIESPPTAQLVFFHETRGQSYPPCGVKVILLGGCFLIVQSRFHGERSSRCVL